MIKVYTASPQILKKIFTLRISPCYLCNNTTCERPFFFFFEKTLREVKVSTSTLVSYILVVLDLVIHKSKQTAALQIFANVDFLPIDNDSGKKKVAKKYKPFQIP